jgi:Tol biopolymer transport system component
MGSGPTRVLVLSLSVCVAAAIAGCSDDSEVGSDSLEVAEVQGLDLPFADAFLSPNGERIATYVDDELCVYTSDGEQESCAEDLPEIDPNSIQWDTGGTRLAFTENYFVYFHEPDIWTYDVDSEELTNLTDDGVDEVDLTEELPDAARTDTTPVWRNDSTIWFVRTTRDEEPAEVMELSVDGGEAESVGTLDTAQAPFIFAVTPDGDRVAYERADEEDVVVSDLGGDNLTTLAEPTAYSVSVSSSGDDLLVSPIRASADPSQYPPSEVVPADGGDGTELDESAFWATWRTEGDGLLYASQTGEAADPTELSLRLADDAGDEGHEVTTGPFLPPYRQASWRLPVWSSQDTVLLMRRDEAEAAGFQYVLLRLGEE